MENMDELTLNPKILNITYNEKVVSFRARSTFPFPFPPSLPSHSPLSLFSLSHATRRIKIFLSCHSFPLKHEKRTRTRFFSPVACTCPFFSYVVDHLPTHVIDPLLCTLVPFLPFVPLLCCHVRVSGRKMCYFGCGGCLVLFVTNFFGQR
jgi:hypothetical protein